MEKKYKCKYVMIVVLIITVFYYCVNIVKSFVKVHPECMLHVKNLNWHSSIINNNHNYNLFKMSFKWLRTKNMYFMNNYYVQNIESRKGLSDYKYSNNKSGLINSFVHVSSRFYNGNNAYSTAST